jgi:lipopolysaccharide export system protein LptC
MTAFFKTHYGYLYLAGIAIASWLMVNLTEVDEEGSRILPPHSPDFFSTGYKKWEMDTHGLVNSRLNADTIIHYSDDNTTHLGKPLLYLHQEQQTPWLIQANIGNVSADGKTILLQGQTVIARDANGNSKSLKINTSNLTVKPEIHFAETADQAELLSPPNKTTGIGMKLVFKHPIRIELLAHVQGKYEKQP